MKELAPLRLKFSHEELVAMLELAGLPMIAGVGDKPFGDMPENIIKLLNQVGLRSLLARDIAAIKSNEQIVVDEQIAKLLFFCAYPQKLLTLIWQEKDIAVQVEHVYQVLDLTIIQSQIYPGVHEFILFASEKEILDRLLEPMACSDGIPADNSFSVPRSIFDENNAFDDSISRFKLKALLSASGMAASAVEDFSQAMFTDKKMLLMNIVRQDEKNIPADTKVFLFSEKGCWLLEGFADFAHADLVITPLSSDALAQQFLSVLQ